MATGLVTPRATSAMSVTNRRNNLPVIEHPMSRMGDKNALKIRGTSRGSATSSLGLGPRMHTFVSVDADQDGNVELGLDRSNLPPLRRGSPTGDNSNEDTRFRHSRLLTWPPVHLQKPYDKRAKTAGAIDLDVIARNKYGADELYELVKEKLTNGYFGLKQLFRANDPQGKGTVSRIALSRIIYHLCGYLTPDQQHKLLARIGLDKSEAISFDDFVGRFRENEVVQREWLSPAAKKELSAERKRLHPEESLRDKNVLRETHREYASAAFAIALLKQKIYEGSFNIRRHLSSVCFEPNGLIVPPQLREMVLSLGVRLDDDEFQKLWDRFDLENAGAISSSSFFTQFGLDEHGRPHVRISSPGRHSSRQSRRYPKTSWVPNIPEEMTENTQEGEEVEAAEPEVEKKEEITNGPRQPSLDIVSFIIRKFEHNFHALRMGFEHFDPNGDGFISRPDFRNVMLEYDFPMTAIDCEYFLERCGVRQPDGKVNYKELLLRFMSRADRDLANKIISDPNHRFNTRVSTPAGYLHATDVEAKLVEYFHKEFLRLLSALRNLDKHNLGLITQRQLRDTIDRIFDTKVSDFQFSQLLDEIGLEGDGLVSYEKFLALFNRKRPWILIGVQTIATPQVRTPKERPHTAAVEEMVVVTPKPEEVLPVAEVKTQQPIPVTPPEFEKMWEKEAKKAGLIVEEEKTYPLRNRPRKMLEDAIRDILKTQFHSAQKAYHKIDRKAVGRLSKPQFHKWLSELGIMLNMQELDDLWSTLQVSKDGIVHFSEIYVHFTQFKSEPPSIEGKLPMEDTGDLIDQMRRAQQAQKQRVKELQEKSRLEKERKERARLEKKMRRLSPTDQFSPPTDNVLERLRPHVVKHWNELKKQFRILDPNGYATVTRTEIKAVLQSLKFPVTSGEVDKLCSRFDLNIDGHFHYMQFLELYTQPEKMSHNVHKSDIPGKMEKHTFDSDKSATLGAVIGRVKKKLLTDWKTLRRSFKKSDIANEGYLDAAEFRQILLDNSIVASEEDLYHLLAEFDKNLDGRICYDEFLNTMLS